MSIQDLYSHGQWNVICDACGRKFKNGDLRKRWDNLMVCNYDYEERQPQDFVRAAVDRLSVPWSRSEPSDIFDSGGLCTVASRSCYAEMATADCALADNTPDSYDNLLSGYVCDYNSMRATAGEGVSGCVRAGYNPY